MGHRSAGVARWMTHQLLSVKLSNGRKRTAKYGSRFVGNGSGETWSLVAAWIAWLAVDRADRAAQLRIVAMSTKLICRKTRKTEVHIRLAIADYSLLQILMTRSGKNVLFCEFRTVGLPALCMQVKVNKPQWISIPCCAP